MRRAFPVVAVLAFVSSWACAPGPGDPDAEPGPPAPPAPDAALPAPPREPGAAPPDAGPAPPDASPGPSDAGADRREVAASDAAGRPDGARGDAVGDAGAARSCAEARRGRWPDDGVTIRIPYVDDRAGFGSRWTNVERALQHIHARTRVRFVERRGEADYVSIEPGGDICQLGRQGGYQWCRPSGNYWQVVVHELGHAIGLSHEHQRWDRDEHIVVFADRTTNWGSYRKLSQAEAPTYRPYDFSSIMHYGPTQFSATGQHVMEPNRSRYPDAPTWPAPGALITPMVAKSGLSAGDLLNIQALYPGCRP